MYVFVCFLSHTKMKNPEGRIIVQLISCYTLNAWYHTWYIAGTHYLFLNERNEFFVSELLQDFAEIILHVLTQELQLFHAYLFILQACMLLEDLCFISLGVPRKHSDTGTISNTPNINYSLSFHKGLSGFHMN